MKSKLLIIWIVLILIIMSNIPITFGYDNYNDVKYIMDEPENHAKIQDEILSSNNVELQTLVLYVGFISNITYSNDYGGFYTFNSYNLIAFYWLKEYGFHIQNYKSGEGLRIVLNYISIDAEFIFKGYIGDRFICGIQIIKFSN